MKKLILIFTLCASAWAAEPTIKGVKVVTSPTDKVTGTVPVWNGTAWISGTNGSGSGDTIWTNSAGTIQASSTAVDSGSSAVAFEFDTVNALTNALIAKFAVGGSNVVTIRHQNQDGDGGKRVRFIVGTDEGSNTDAFFAVGTKGTTNRNVDLSLYLENRNSIDLFVDETSVSFAGYTGADISFLEDPSLIYGEDSAYIYSTATTLNSGNLAKWQNNLTNKVWITFDGESHAKDFVMEGSALKTDTTAGHVGNIQVYDNDDATYRNVISFTNGNTPTATVGGVTGLTTTVQPTILKSSDGSTGLTTNITAGLVTFTIKNGIITGVSL